MTFLLPPSIKRLILLFDFTLIASTLIDVLHQLMVFNSLISTKTMPSIPGFWYNTSILVLSHFVVPVRNSFLLKFRVIAGKAYCNNHDVGLAF